MSLALLSPVFSTMLRGIYITGAVLSGLVFSRLIDCLGRCNLFFILYLGATAARTFSCDLKSFLLFPFLTGIGIGSE